MKFRDITLSQQEKIKKLAYAYHTIRGSANPKKEVEELTWKDKSKKKWRNQPYYFMLAIDSYREKMGLPKIYT